MNNALPWSAPHIDGRLAPGRRSSRSADQDAQEKRIWDEAQAAGHAAGMAAAQQEVDARLRNLDALAASLQNTLQALSRPLAHVDDSLHEQVTRLAVAIARGLVRRELRTDPAQVIGIVRETVGLLPASSRGVRILLHPEDAALVRERLSMPQSDQAWSVMEDPVLSRGDCRVVAEYAQIDARLESRLAAVIAEMLGDERTAPRTEGDR